jgi:hypothetical protein
MVYHRTCDVIDRDLLLKNGLLKKMNSYRQALYFAYL